MATQRKPPKGLDAVDEATPLLGGSTNGAPADQHNGSLKPPVATNNGDRPNHGTANAEEEQEDETPMPYRQILLLCYASVAEPIAYFAIFPFINEMIEVKGHISPQNVGFWSGMIESLFSVVQMLLMIFYGRAADRLGRKPVLVFSLAGVGFATVSFGFAGNLWQMVVMRCLAGVFAGSVVTVRTMISENCTKRTQGRAFSWYMFTRNMGIFIGPLIGGGLANPAEQFPSVFGGVPFWTTYPYVLATIVAGTVVLSSALTSLLFLKETLKRKTEDKAQVEAPMSTWQVLKSPGVPIVLYIFGHIMLLALAYTAVSPVFMYTNISLGGFSFSDQQISLFIAIGGGSQAIWMLAVFPSVQKRFGTGTLLRWCAAAWPFFMAVYPIMNEFLREGWTTAFWVLGPIMIVLGSSVAMAFACAQLCINDISPSSEVLATVNALALTVNSGVRAFAPVLGTSIFASGIKWGWADGHLVWFLLVAWAMLLNVVCNYLPEAAEGRPEKKAEAQG